MAVLSGNDDIMLTLRWLSSTHLEWDIWIRFFNLYRMTEMIVDIQGWWELWARYRGWCQGWWRGWWGWWRSWSQIQIWTMNVAFQQSLQFRVTWMSFCSPHSTVSHSFVQFCKILLSTQHSHSSQCKIKSAFLCFYISWYVALDLFLTVDSIFNFYYLYLYLCL